MKIRNGFVSNSSSSSFVVAFDKIPKTWEELRVLMFPDLEQKTILHESWPKDVKINIDSIVKQVFKDMKNNNPLSDDEILEQISFGCFDGYPRCDLTDKPLHDFEEEFYNKFGSCTSWDDHPDWNKRRCKVIDDCEKVYKKVFKQALDKFYEDNKDKFKDRKCLKFEYSDNDGELASTMEHDGIFYNMPHIIISHH